MYKMRIEDKLEHTILTLLELLRDETTTKENVGLIIDTLEGIGWSPCENCGEWEEKDRNDECSECSYIHMKPNDDVSFNKD